QSPSLARLLREPPVKSARRARRPFRSATAWPNDIRYTNGVTPKSICIGPAWPDMANKNDWQSAAADDLLRATPRTMCRIVSIRRDYQDGGRTMQQLGMLGIIGGPAILTAAPLSRQWSPKNVALTLDSAEAQIGPPPTATSVAGVDRRIHRRAYRSAAYASAAGYGSGLYSGYGCPASNYWVP